MASLKYKLSHVSQAIGMLICLQLRVYMKGITGSAGSRGSCNALWSAAKSQHLLGRPRGGAASAVCRPTAYIGPGADSGTRLTSEDGMPSVFMVCFYVGCWRTGNIWYGMKPTATNFAFSESTSYCLGEMILNRCCYFRIGFSIVARRIVGWSPCCSRCHCFAPECLQVQDLLLGNSTGFKQTNKKSTTVTNEQQTAHKFLLNANNLLRPLNIAW